MDRDKPNGNIPHGNTSPNNPFQPHTDFTRFSEEASDKDKSLTSRARAAARPPTYPHPQPTSSPLGDSDPRLLDSYILSRLHFEEFLRSQSDLFHQFMAEREKALSVKSDSVTQTRDRGDRQRAGSSQSEIINQYSSPLGKQGLGNHAARERHPSKFSDYDWSGSSYKHVRNNGVSADQGFGDRSRENLIREERSGKGHLNNNHTDNKLFASSIIRTSSLTELEHLVDHCIMPEDQVTSPPVPTRPVVPKRLPVVPRARNIPATEPPSPDSEKHQMLLGGVLSMPHSSRFVLEERSNVVPMNGHANQCDSKDVRQSPKSKPANKSSLFSFKKSKNKGKSKPEREGAT